MVESLTLKMLELQWAEEKLAKEYSDAEDYENYRIHFAKAEAYQNARFEIAHIMYKANEEFAKLFNALQ